MTCKCIKCESISSCFWHSIEVNGQSGWLCDKCFVGLYNWLHNEESVDKQLEKDLIDIGVYAENIIHRIKVIRGKESR